MGRVPGPGKRPRTPKMGVSAWRSLLNYSMVYPYLEKDPSLYLKCHSKVAHGHLLNPKRKLHRRASAPAHTRHEVKPARTQAGQNSCSKYATMPIFLSSASITALQIWISGLPYNAQFRAPAGLTKRALRARSARDERSEEGDANSSPEA